MSSSVLAAVLLLGSALFHQTAAEAPGCGSSDEACPAGSSGTAMLQTGIDKRSRDSSLEGRIATLDAELTSLESRVAIMMSTVGLSGGAALVAKSESSTYERYRALLKHTYQAEDLITVVGDLEAKADSVKDNIVSIEDEVSGNQIRNSGALLEEKNGIQMRAIGDSLTNRVTALEEVVSSLKDRAIAMEEKIAGMGSKA